MNSIRTKTTLLTVCIFVVAVTVATILGVSAIRNIGTSSADQMLLLLCETGEKNLDAYFTGVEQAVEMVSAYVESDMTGLEDDELQAHLDRVQEIFSRLTYMTNGVLTYYYRIDPAVSTTAKGFWYVYQGRDGFVRHEVTDITLYDTEDTSALVWFTVPKHTGTPVWLPPYITDNLDVRVISFNAPIYFEGTFVGVIGIEIDCKTMEQEVNHITLYENGYAFVNDADGRIVYHPRMDVTAMETQPTVPDGLLSKSTFIHYTFDGVEKQAVWLTLVNGMRLNVTVPVAEINGEWHRWVNEIIIVSIVLLVVFIIVTLRFTGRITKPLRELTAIAGQVNEGNYDCRLDYKGRDEVGILTKAINGLIAHLKTYIGSLNDLAYADALTSVRNKGAFVIYLQNLDTEIREAAGKPAFAILIFDCNNLKMINDRYGHDKGDVYLKSTCRLICDVYDHSPVFRIGGDEFAVVLQNSDYDNREALLKQFDEAGAAMRSQNDAFWEQVDVARGMAVYDPDGDETTNDVLRRADRLMYENKWLTKERRKKAAG